MSIEKEALSLQIKKEHLAPFMERVLGKEQSVRKGFHGSFVLDKNWLNNLYYLINQRIISQHKANLVGFYFKINLTGGYERVLNTIEQFLSFNEILSEEVIGIEFSLKYLVFFGEKDTPEIQSINLIVTKKESGGNLIKASNKNVIENLVINLLRMNVNNESNINLKIESTQRSFSDDLI
ncbi:hypothetical protein J9236_20795, partial [Providencia rettgeri]|uniref:hypothetical protein n=1 Tax=Providencia rettgeri TaxID=587 RepID=UPI001B360393